MKIGRDIEKYLKMLGLTGSEVKIYILLLNSGPLTAKEISDHSNVPFSKIYLVLNSLRDKGWISIVDDRPAKYTALSPNEAIKRAKIHKEREWNEAVTRLMPVLQSMYDARQAQESPDVWIVRGEENISSKILDLIFKSRYELLMALHARLESLFEKARILDKLGSPLIPKDVRILLPRDLIKDVVFFRKLGAELRYRDTLFGGGVIADTREALLILGDESSVDTAIWSTHATLIYLARTYFDKLWETAEVVEVGT